MYVSIYILVQIVDMCSNEEEFKRRVKLTVEFIWTNERYLMKENDFQPKCFSSSFEELCDVCLV